MTTTSAVPRTGPPVIATPDRRVRVFISSTMRELEPERRAARDAVRRLRLTPVMFELGARPHSPRELYRAYLSQSDVFVGIYWQQYGMVAPGESVSGLEDEYLLAGDRPKLIYVKRPAADRDDRLTALLDRVRSDDGASYKSFGSAEELAELLADDMAVLLTDRFTAEPDAHPDLRSGRLPMPLTPTIDRESDVAAVARLLERPGVRLVTLTGPGGIGKTRLALASAAAVADGMDGTWFVDLAPVSDVDHVPPTIAAAFGVRAEGERQVLDVLKDRLDGIRPLLVLDNVEQVRPAAAQLVDLLTAVPGLRILATSRAALDLRGEHQYPVAPLAAPPPDEPVADVAEAGAVQLFVARAQEVRPGFELTAENAEAVAAICRRLEGIPLAIELAAAQLRLLTPQALLDRLGAGLDLSGGPVDLPARQRTLRATIAWSYGLLGAGERTLLDRLSVFAGSWTLEAAGAVAADSGDALGGVSTLVAQSLVSVDDRSETEPRFRMFDTVREYARERLAGSGAEAAVMRRLADYLRTVAGRAGVALLGPENRTEFARLDAEADDIQATMRWAIANDDAETAIALPAPLFTYWWGRGQLAPMLTLAEQTAALPSAAALPPTAAAKLLWARAMLRVALGRTAQAVPLLRQLVVDAAAVGDERLLAHARAGLGLSLPYDTDAAEARELLDAATAGFRRLGDAWGVAFALTPRGQIAVRDGQPGEAAKMHREALAMAERIDNDVLRAMALDQLGFDALLSGDVAGARRRLAAAAEVHRRLPDLEGLSYCLGGFAAVALAQRRAEPAVRLLAAADRMREMIGVAVWPLMRPLAEQLVQAAHAAVPEPQLSEAIKAGAALGPSDALAYALDATG